MIRKKIRYTIILSFAFIVCVICAMLYSGCKTQDKPTPAPPEPSNSDITITLNVSLLELHQYETAVINADVSDGSSAKFSSSDEAIAAVESNGTVIAKSAGACDIIVTAKDASAKCRVIVSTSPYKAKIQGVKDEIRIVSGTSFKTALSADYNGTLVDENIDYSVSLTENAAEGIAEASVADGLLTVTGTKTGITSFSVFAEIRGALSEKTFVVIVYGDEVVIDPENEADFKRNGGFYGLTLITENGESGLKNRVALDFNVLINGVEQEGKNVEFDVAADYNKDFNAAQAEVSGNAADGYAVTAKARGTTILTGKYTYNGEDTFVKIELTVKLPEKNIAETIIVGRGNGEVTVPSGLEGKLEEITVDGVTTSVAVSGNTATLDKNVLPDGGNELLSAEMAIYTDKYCYRATAKICTKILTKAIDFDEFKMVDGKYRAFIGYYMLTGDVDFSGYGVCTAIRDNSNPSNSATGFRGVLDGNGHQLKNVTVGAGGIFGHIGSGAVIKNITFDNVHYNNAMNSALLAHTIRDADLIDITVNVSEYEVQEQVKGYVIKYDVGFLSSRFLTESRLKNVKINAAGKNIVNIFGHRCTSNEFENVEITAASYKIIGCNSDNAVPENEIKSMPTGVTFITK